MGAKTAAARSAFTVREEQRAAFLSEIGWGAAETAPLAGDASNRLYLRLRLGQRRAVLMDAPPASESASCPPGASPAERERLGYNALARLAGPNMNAFLCIAEALRDLGLSAPEIYAADPETGFALLEDLGDALFSQAIAAGADEAALYAAAIDVLCRLHAAPPAETLTTRHGAYQLQTYDKTALTAEISLLPDWYWPHRLGDAPSRTAKAEFLASWRAPFALAVNAPPALTLRDYHADNLIWLERREGAARAGLLDFQDAVIGHPAYDLVSLLCDVRRDVSPETRAAMLQRYCDHRRADDSQFDADAFRAGYAVLGAQRNTKIVGIFARLANRDGKRAYLDYLPRAERLLRENLADPAMAPVRAWLDASAPAELSL
ncbi:MAG: phosphotransferase [Pseudomonadota bacterium]